MNQPPESPVSEVTNQADVQPHPAPTSGEPAEAPIHAPKIVRVGLRIVHVPTLELDPCECGFAMATTHKPTVDLARRNKPFHVTCKRCGAIVEAQQTLILPARRASRGGLIT